MGIRTIAKHLPIGLFVLALCFFVGAVFDVGHYHFFGPGLWPPVIACEAPVHDLGSLSSDQSFSCEFTIRNTGSRPLLIEKVKPGCGGCIRVDSFPTEPISRGNEGVVLVSLLTEELQGAVEKKVAVFSNDAKSGPLILTLRADIRQASAVSTVADELSD